MCSSQSSAIPVTCKICGKKSSKISKDLQVCGDCIRENFAEAEKYIKSIHEKVRSQYNLPSSPPDNSEGVKCGFCGNNCRIPENGKGFCGGVENKNGGLVRKFGSPENGLLRWYKDPLPTNCVSAWCCAGSSGAGYPKWSRTPKGDINHDNLAVFLGSCTYNCLYCQNSSFKQLTENKKPVMAAENLAEKVDEKTGCICYFGGDPSSQIPFVIHSARKAHKFAKQEGRILRICLETNLNMNKPGLEEISEISIKSGGGIKADLKCWSTEVLYALSGIKHRKSFENFELIGKRNEERPEVPFARASTLIVPGYVDTLEIRKIASFIADIDPTIPYSLLAFSPHYYMKDMPYLQKEEADELLGICKDEGLEKVRIGNPWLVS